MNEEGDWSPASCASASAFLRRLFAMVIFLANARAELVL